MPFPRRCVGTILLGTATIAGWHAFPGLPDDRLSHRDRTGLHCRETGEGPGCRAQVHSGVHTSTSASCSWRSAHAWAAAASCAARRRRSLPSFSACARASTAAFSACRCSAPMRRSCRMRCCAAALSSRSRPLCMRWGGLFLFPERLMCIRVGPRNGAPSSAGLRQGLGSGVPHRAVKASAAE